MSHKKKKEGSEVEGGMETIIIIERISKVQKTPLPFRTSPLKAETPVREWRLHYYTAFLSEIKEF